MSGKRAGWGTIALVAFAVALGAVPSVSAQTVTVPFAVVAPTVAVPIPPWAIGSLSVLLAMVAGWTLRQRLRGWRGALLLMVAACLVAGTSGEWIPRVMAAGAGVTSFDLVPPSPMTSPTLAVGGDVAVRNATGGMVRLHTPVPSAGYTLGSPGATPQCQAGLELPALATCYLRLAGSAPTNQMPIVNAGTNQTITLPATAALSGSATDDGLPTPPGAVTYGWSKLSGPGTVTFGNAAQPVTTAGFSVAGSYVLRLTANDGALAGTGDVTITVNAASASTPQIAAVADRTIELGSRFQQVVQAIAGSNPTLNYSLSTAPTGAGLVPAPLIDWTPTAAQVGPHNFTVRVVDGAGQVATASFTVTVTHTNHPPLLQPQANATVSIGAAFSRTLVASDPDAGDVLSYSLVSGPAGMTLTGAGLGWPTAGVTAGDYAVTVRVTDDGGLADSKSFTLTLRAPVAPATKDDAYEVKLGQTLTVPAPGVLGNDLDPMAAGLTAGKLTNPDKGSLTAFNGDGSFTYQAPANLVRTFQPAVKWISVAPASDGAAALGNLLAVDVDGDGKPEIFSGQPAISLWGQRGISAIHGSDGSLMWGSTELWLPPVANGGPAPLYCSIEIRSNQPDAMAVGDIDDSGHPAIVVPLQCPGGPNAYPTTPAPPSSRLAAFDARTGALKWISEDLGYSHNGNTTFYNQLMWYIVPAIARLGPGETPTVLFKKRIYGTWPGAGPGETYCNDFQSGTGDKCTVVIGVDGATGAKRRTWVAPIDIADEDSRGGYVTVADVTGDGVPDIVADGAVWTVDGTMVSNRLSGRRISGLALANLDDSGQTAIVSHECYWECWVVARKPDGTVLWETPTDATGASVWGEIVVADLYGDGRPKILVSTYGNLYAYDERGAMVWTHRFATASNISTLHQYFRPVVFDLDGDGVPEVIVQAQDYLYFFDGRTAALKAKLSYQADIGYPSNLWDGRLTPIVIDADGDGHAEVVFNLVGPYYPLRGWIVALTAAPGTTAWQPARPVWNQFAMHDANVTDTGHIPYPEVNNFATPRTNVFANPARIAPPVDPRKREQASFTYRATAGGLDSNAATVTIDLVPPNRPPVFTSAAPTMYMKYGSAGPGNPYVPFVYYAHASDPDPGDTLTYSIVSRTGTESASFRIDAATGKVDVQGGILYGSPYNGGIDWIVIAVTDSYGETAYQTLTLKPSTGPIAVPNVVGKSKTAAAAALTAAGFATGTIGGAYNLAPVDQVLSQYPVGGATAMAGSAVALQVSLGLAPIALPNLVGRPLPEVQPLLQGYGFQVLVNPVVSPNVPASQVIAQNPPFGTSLAPGNPVTLDVSVGPPLAGTVARVIVEPEPNATRLVNESLQYRATAVFTDDTATDVTLRAVWGSSIGSAASVDGVGNARGLAAGTTVISATAGGQTGQSTLNVVARVAETTNPVAQITAPTDGAAVTGPTPVTGTATDANLLRWELAYALADDPAWTVFAEGTSAVSAGTLGTFDPTVLVNDQYTLRLTVYDRAGNSTVETRTVQVKGNIKPGLFTLAFQDLNVPMSGIPITATRTYDSRDKAQGDFGIGWRLGFNTIRLRTNRVPGTGWVRQLGSLGVVNLVAAAAHKVSLTLPDGKVEEFDLVLSPMSGFGGLDFTTVSGYAPRVGTLGTLQLLGNPNLLIVNGGAEDELVDDVTFNTFNPKHYRYTTVDGAQVELGPQTGVTKITDRNGNSIAFGANGIVHSSGKSVTFARDGLGRIAAITDPSGAIQTYAYDANGDLVAHTTAADATSRYRYDRQHNLIDLQDPAGNHATRNTYDSAGRMITTTDANGHTVILGHDLGAATEAVTDRMGNVTLFAYDARGNVTSKTDPLGHTTTFTYDSRDNQLTEVDPLGRVASKTYDAKNNVLTRTDFQGNTTTTTYDAFGQVLTQLDPEGRLATNIYDGNGNLTQVTDPEGGVTHHAYDAAGNLTSTTDPLGRTTSLAYDASGNLTSRTNPLGHVTTYTYDGNGRCQTETDPLGRTTSFSRDGNGQLSGRTDPLGNTTRALYSNVGLGAKVSRVSDPVGNATSFAYDPAGNRTGVTFANGSAVAFSFDANTKPSGASDADGRSVQVARDAVGRPRQLTLTNGANRTLAYDAAGRVVSLTDERGNVTATSYALNREIVTNTLGHVTVNDYDSNRRLVKRTDALGHSTTYAYDSVGNQVRTTYPDGTFRNISYDAAKQKIAETDQAGRSTQFTYDAAGRLVRVTDALGGMTTYTYDAAGNRLTQTDANGHTTQMTYDAMNRLVTRTRPSGKQESFVYDAVGNRISRTDFNGRTTTYVYDAMTRPTRKQLPDGTRVTYTYTAAGLRSQAGGDHFSFDAEGRLTQEQKASGEILGYGYDLAGNRTSLTTPQGTSNYTYDAQNRLHTVVDATGTTTYAYDAAGRKASIARPSGVTTTYGYDSLDRLVQVANTGPGGLISSYTYTLDPAGHRTHVVEAGSATTGRNVSYTYDALYRLTQEQITEPGPMVSTIAYTFDPVSNRLQRTRNGVATNYVYDTDDRLLTETTAGSTATSSWDDNGNLVSRSSSAGSETYGYDGENRLVSVALPAGSYTYAYDADGIRTSRTLAGVATNFLVDKNRDFAQVLTESAGANVFAYSWGDQLLAAQGSDGSARFYLSDGLRSTRQLTSNAGVVTDSYTYDAFGAPLTSTGVSANPYRYVGEQQDPGTGSYYLRARYFDTNTGRFPTADPWLGSALQPMSLHRYLYANANPVDMQDPSGRTSNLVETMVVLGINATLGAAGSYAGLRLRNHAQRKVTTASETAWALGTGAVFGLFMGGTAIATGAGGGMAAYGAGTYTWVSLVGTLTGQRLVQASLHPSLFPVARTVIFEMLETGFFSLFFPFAWKSTVEPLAEYYDRKYESRELQWTIIQTYLGPNGEPLETPRLIAVPPAFTRG